MPLIPSSMVVLFIQSSVRKSVTQSYVVYSSDPDVVRALHAPTKVTWIEQIDYPWNSRSSLHCHVLRVLLTVMSESNAKDPSKIIFITVLHSVQC
jgi:hypothetical protein